MVISQGNQVLLENHKKLEEAGKDSLPRVSRGRWPCRHLDLGLLAFRTMRGYISVMLRLKVFITAPMGKSNTSLNITEFTVPCVVSL